MVVITGDSRGFNMSSVGYISNCVRVFRHFVIYSIILHNLQCYPLFALTFFKTSCLTAVIRSCPI